MPSVERIAGQTRRTFIAARYQQTLDSLAHEHEPTPGDRIARTYEAESIRLRAAKATLSGEEPYHEPRFTADKLPHPVPEKLKLGWRADAEVHGWYGGCESQLEYIEAQSGRISQVRLSIA